MAQLKEAGIPGMSDAVPDYPLLRIGDRLDIVHVVYHPTAIELPSSDAEFSRSSIALRRQAGYRDMAHAIEVAPWFEAAKIAGAVVHRVEKQQVMTQTQPDLRRTTGLKGQGNGAAPSADGSKRA